MKDILQDLSTQNLISAIEGNLFGTLLTIRKWPKAEVHDEKEILWSVTDNPFPVFNSILRAHLAPGRIDAVIESIIAQAKTRNVSLLWWTGPATQPGNLGKHLERHGFLNGGQIPGMALDLEKLNINPPMPEGLTVQRVKDDATLKIWSQVCGEAFGMPDFAGEGFYDWIRHGDQDEVWAYVGWLDGKPVASSLLVLAAGVAGMYNIATLPSARGKGIGARMTDLPLLEARNLGYRAGILHSSEMGEGVYRSLGFEEYCKIGQYIWSPQS